MEATLALNRTELRRYLERIGDRWRLDGAFLGGTALNGELEPGGGASYGETDPEQETLYGDTDPGGDAPATFTVVLVSDAFDEVPWLERVHVAAALWDAHEMGAPAQAHCYTTAEFERRRETAPAVIDAIWHGLDLLALI